MGPFGSWSSAALRHSFGFGPDPGAPSAAPRPLMLPAKGISMRSVLRSLLLTVHAFVAPLAHRGDPTALRRWRGAAGQTTAEYALVLLGAAAIAALVVTWATKSGAIGKLFEAVLSHVIGAVT